MSIFAIEKFEAVRKDGKVSFYKLYENGECLLDKFYIMITFDELKSTQEYWTTRIQLTLYSCIKDYMEQNNISRTELAQRLGVTKGYITQLLNGNFDHRLSKLVELSLAIGLIPQINFIPANEFNPNTQPEKPIYQGKSSESRDAHKFKIEKGLKTEYHLRNTPNKRKTERTYC